MFSKKPFNLDKLIVDSYIHLSEGKHYGLIGRNGSGKSSLLNYILNNVNGTLLCQQSIKCDDRPSYQFILSSCTDVDDSTESQVKSVMHGLGFTQEQMSAPSIC